VIHTPVARAYATVIADGTADLFVDPEKLTDEVILHLGNAVRLHPRAAFVRHLSAHSNKRVAVDPDRTVAAIFETLEAAGATSRDRGI
jgi:Xaa-Pro aminopeptidase